MELDRLNYQKIKKKYLQYLNSQEVMSEPFRDKLGQLNKFYFDTLKVNVESKEIRLIAEKAKINLNYIDNNTVSISLNETTGKIELEALFKIFSIYANNINKKGGGNPISLIRIPKSTTRVKSFMTHSVFNSYHSETALMRYIKSLELKDLALNHSMISLGSCTMKLNAAAEMLPLSSPNWNSIHPFVPVNQAKGYHEILKALISLMLVF